MLFNRFTNRFRPKDARTGPVRCEGVDSAEAFGHIIERERMRADRSGKVCSLAAFTLTVRDGNHEIFQQFTEILQPRLRATDHAGWMSKTVIGVTLWDTSAVGATKFIDTLLSQCDFADDITTEIFIYPTPRNPTDRKHKQSINDPYPPNCTEQNCTEQNCTEQSSPSGDDCSENDHSRNGPPVQPLEMLFVRPLPMWKRGIDIFGAVVGLVFLSPLLLLTAALIKWTSPGPVFFKQLRDGLAGRQFTIYKFRTMTVDAEAQKTELRRHSEQDGPAFKMTHDPRVTPLGGYLRKTCLDELPQLWNVLKGDMTLVGPRPLDSREAEQINSWGRRRIEVTPGLTCIWQVHGKSKVSFAEWMRMDIRYMKRRTLWHDIVLVYQTVVDVLLHRGSC